MISIYSMCGKVPERIIDANTFPDKTFATRYSPKDHIGDFAGVIVIKWLFDDNSECMLLWSIVNHIRDYDPKALISLELPYVPNGRMDRVKNPDEVFTLKWFGEFINCMNFSFVLITDPHSSASCNMIKNSISVDPEFFIRKTIEEINCDPLICFPDSGAASKYKSLVEKKYEYVSCEKIRDWRTGRINGLKLNNPDKVHGKNILIIDDICSRGGTFFYTAQELKKSGAKDIYLYVTHCENTIFDGELISTDLIKHIYTTNSIYRGSHSKITII